jgi:protocatechuate 3,4-dioxygenase beta subunit
MRVTHLLPKPIYTTLNSSQLEIKENPMNPNPIHQQDDNDDEMVGRIISRRAALRLFGAAVGGTALLSSQPQRVIAQSTSSLPSCVVRPAMTEGPFFVDENLNRSDIRSDPSSKKVSAGAALRLTFLVSSIGSKGCAALKGAMVDIWQCDAAGVYSDVQGAVGQKFLRGHQITDASGKAQFVTIYPGWYPGRTVHIHFKIRYGKEEFTSQLFFDDAMTDQVFQAPPYAARGRRNTRNNNDNIYRNGGSQLLLAVKPEGAGYGATFDIGLNLN